jgi:hypothetical protein
MIATCISNLKSALAETPGWQALERLGSGALQRRLQALSPRSIHLRPGDPHAYRVLALLYRLPDLRPAPRSVLLNYLHLNLDLPSMIEESCLSDDPDPDAFPEPEAEAESAPPPLPVNAACENLPPLPSTNPAAPLYANKRPADLFDRFLDWVAGLVG